MFNDLADEILTSSIAVFGQPVIYTSLAGGSFAIEGIFEAAHRSIDFRDGLEISTVHPAIDVRLADFLECPVQGDLFKIGCNDYEVIDVQKDGHGAAKLLLNKLT